jgi:hypothetical protein
MARYNGGAEKAKQTNKIYSEIARRNNCSFIDVNQLKVGIDGVHLIEESHIELARLLCNEVKLMEF